MKVIALILLLVIVTPLTTLASSASEEAAERVARLQNSPEMQAAIKEQARRIKEKELLKDRQQKEVEPSPELTESAPETKMEKPQILIFISSSMPEETLIRLVEEGARLMERDAAQVLYVIRGEPEIGLKPFGTKINPNNRGITLRVDPFLFQKLEIDSVPLVIVDRMYAILHPSSLGSAINNIVEAGYGDLATILSY